MNTGEFLSSFWINPCQETSAVTPSPPPLSPAPARGLSRGSPWKHLAKTFVKTIIKDAKHELPAATRRPQDTTWWPWDISRWIILLLLRDHESLSWWEVYTFLCWWWEFSWYWWDISWSHRDFSPWDHEMISWCGRGEVFSVHHENSHGNYDISHGLIVKQKISPPPPRDSLVVSWWNYYYFVINCV